MFDAARAILTEDVLCCHCPICDTSLESSKCPPHSAAGLRYIALMVLHWRSLIHIHCSSGADSQSTVDLLVQEGSHVKNYT